VIGSVAVVGASLAGVGTARALRELGFDGRVTVIGAEPHRPYDRPPLSKELLAGKETAADIALIADDEELDVEWLLGRRAVELVPGERAVRLDDGTVVHTDAVVVATGARARSLPIPSPGAHMLRSLDDAHRLAGELRPGTRLVVIGGGFIGCEVAATSRGMGVDVTIVEATPLPLGAVLGPVLAERLVRPHREHGVRFVCGIPVSAITPHAVVLDDGTELPADVVLVAVGAIPETEWLRGSGVALAADGGVIADRHCRTTLPSVLVAGDVATAEHQYLGGPARVEHWANAVEQAQVAAAALLGAPGAAVGDLPPYFWSDQYGSRLQLAGRPGPGDTFRAVDGEPADDAFAGVCERGARVTAVVALDRPRSFGRLRRELAARPA
jgi:NADPH-dependent 2,4-dienoyl-CoA reductase/sulfur reductase-like enzyme